jgi:hypothetical protein
VNFEHQEVFQLVEAGLGMVTAEIWQDTMHHIIEEDKKIWKSEGLTYIVLDNFVTNDGYDETSRDHFNSNLE